MFFKKDISYKNLIILAYSKNKLDEGKLCTHYGKYKKKSLSLLALMILFGCSSSKKAESDNDLNLEENQMMVHQLKELYGEASKYNVNTTEVQLADVVTDKDRITFNFRFSSNRDLSEFFKSGFYEKNIKLS